MSKRAALLALPLASAIAWLAIDGVPPALAEAPARAAPLPPAKSGPEKPPAAAAAAAAAAAPAPAANDMASRREAWNKPFPPFQVIGNVHYVGAGVSAFLITTPEGSILLDGGLPETAPLIEKSIAELGFKLRDARFLLNSHAHFDHAGGLAALKKASRAKLVASRGDAFCACATSLPTSSSALIPSSSTWRKRERMRSGGPNPFIDPSELRRFVDRSEQKFREVLAREQREDGSAPAPPSPGPPPH